MDCEEEVDNRKELDEQRRKLQKQLRDLEKFTCMPQGHSEQAQRRVVTAAAYRALTNSGMIFCWSTRERRRGLKRYKASWIRRGTCSRKLLPLGRSEKNSMKERIAFISYRERSIAIGWQQRKWKQNFGACRQVRKEEQVVVECCFDTVAEQLFTMGLEVLYEKIIKRFEAPSLLRKCQIGREVFGKKKKNSQGENPKTFEENSWRKDPSTFESRGHKAERWRVQKNVRKRRKTKKVEYRKRRCWKKTQRDHHKSVYDEDEER